MTLTAGTRLGPFEVLAPLGAGGMGEVYRAKDTRLDRTVALKVLPEEFFEDQERKGRFEREAKTLAALSHPNIAAIYAFEEISGPPGSHGRHLLLMELVEGEDLAQRLAAGPLPLEESLSYAKQIAEALEAAHEKGIVHRDLKPANVKVTPDGRIKLLDFGLAKILENEAAGGSTSGASQSPTLTARTTAAGVILGTAAYMSPEQARGKSVDKRADIWAFGAVLYEMLSGKRAFAGETVSDTLAAVLTKDPDWSALPSGTPAPVRRVLKRCLERDTRARLHDIADARLELDEPPEALETARPLPQPTWRRAVPWVLSAILALALWGGLRPSPAPAPEVRWLQVSAPELSLAKESSIDISRDGSRLVYVGEQDGKRQLYLRPLDSREASPIPNTENALCPFFSPDGQWIGFWADQKLWKMPLSGGWTLLYDSPLSLWGLPLKATWGADGWILFSGIEARGVLQRIRDSGGRPERLVTADAKRNEWHVTQPEILPDREHVLFTASFPVSRVVVQSLKTSQRQTLVEDAFSAHYAPTGHLVYMQGEKLIAAPFDPKRLVITGTPVAMVEGVSKWAIPLAAGYALSDNGTLAFLPAVPADRRRAFVWVDRQGKEQPVANVRGFFASAQLSPNGKKLATFITSDFQVGVLDIERGALTPLTTEGRNAWTIWHPDGRRLVFNSVRTDSPGASLFSQVEDGGAPAERLTTTDLLQQPRSFSPDGSLLIFQELHPDTGYDIWTLPMKKGAKPSPLLRTPFNEFHPSLSPDGRWLAYVSNESGRDEIWVRSFPGMDQRAKVSTGGGGEPVWSRDGRELFYRTSNNPAASSSLMAVNVSTAQGFRADTPRTLFEGPYAIQPFYGQSYDVSPDGKRFVMIKFDPVRSPKEIHVVLNWFEELKRRVPGGRN